MNPALPIMATVDELALLGVSHRRGGAAALEAWQVEVGPERLKTLCDLGVQEWVLLATCNRWNLVLVLPPELGTNALRAALIPTTIATRPYAYRGEGALEHLTRVAASLDSLNPGEDQIMAQVREAFAAARTAGTVGPTLSFAFQTALRVAKRVRREIELAPTHTSLFSLARPELDRAVPTGGQVAVLGAGQMGTLAAKSLTARADLQLLIVNRTPARAAQLAKQVGGKAMDLETFLSRPPAVDALVFALSLSTPLGMDTLARLGGLKLVVDLGIPRNVAAGALPSRVELLNVDTLQAAGQARREGLGERLADAEELVRQELEGVQREWTERQLAPSIRRLRDWYLDTIGDVLPREEAQALAHKFAHVPVKGLRALAREYGLDAANVFLAETGLDELGE